MTTPSRRRRFLVIAGSLLVVVAVVAGVLVHVVLADDPVDHALTDRAVASASSAALGHPARASLDGGSSAGWQPARTAVGAWLQLRWTGAESLSRLRLRQASSGRAVTQVMLTFGDGSRLLSTVAGTTSLLRFAPRRTSVLRITLVAMSSGRGVIGLRDVGVAGGGDDQTPPPPVASAVGLSASASEQVDGSAVPAPALVDGRSGTDLGAGWSSRGASSTVRLTWSRPQEIAAIQLFGSRTGDAVTRSGSIRVDRGPSIDFGAVLGDPDRPTQVAFLPRVARSVTIRMSADRAARIRLAEIRVFTAVRQVARPSQPGTDLPTDDAAAPACSAPADDAGSGDFEVLCPSAGAVVSDSADLFVRAPVGAALDAQLWSNDGRSGPAPAVTASGSRDVRRIAVDLRGVAAGPVTVSIAVAGSDQAIRLPLYRAAAADRPRAQAPDPAPRGDRLVYSEEFDGPVSASLDGARGTYTAAKPEWNGISTFGDAAFADPHGDQGTLAVVGGSDLRMSVGPGEAPGTYRGAMLASARAGGSGFAAQYGYFEARMYLPSSPGTWPAFWLLPTPNLVAPRSPTAEVDAVEYYGHDPTGTCSSTHVYRRDRAPGGVTSCAQRFTSSRVAAAWHTYGVRLDPTTVTFSIDGRTVATAPQVPGGADPMFFLTDLALGGGWPVDLRSTQSRQVAFVDWVRVYV